MYAVYFEKLGQREKERLDKAERRDRGMAAGRGDANGEKRGGSDGDERARKREAVILPRRPYWRNSRGRDPINNGATSRHVSAARRREGRGVGCTCFTSIHCCISLTRVAYTRVSLSLSLSLCPIDVEYTCARM